MAIQDDVSDPPLLPSAPAITILRDLTQLNQPLTRRLAPGQDAPSLVQNLEFTVEIGSAVSPGVYDVAVNLGAVCDYSINSYARMR